MPAFRECCRIDLGRERVPDATNLLNCRHLLEQHNLGAALFEKVGELLLANSMKLSDGTIIDATLIAAPPSTKNQDKARDFTNKHAYKNKPLSEAAQDTNRHKSRDRSKV